MYGYIQAGDGSRDYMREPAAWMRAISALCNSRKEWRTERGAKERRPDEPAFSHSRRLLRGKQRRWTPRILLLFSSSSSGPPPRGPVSVSLAAIARFRHQPPDFAGGDAV